MKIFMTVLMASVAYTSAQQGYSYSPQQQSEFAPAQHHQILSGPVMQILTGAISQHHQSQQSQPQYQLPFTQSLSNQYLPSQQQQQQQQQQKYQQSQQVSMPMPNSLSGLLPAHMKAIRRSRPRVKITKKPIISKSYFIHSAPEETEEDIQEELAQLAQQPRKHYNVLFVKTPAQTSKAAAFNFAKTLNEEKTVVYVLSKKTSAADLQDALADGPQHLNKPEVFFIKYRTPEEAANAQQQIQTQYNSLGGSTTISDEGVAPVTSVVGSLDEPEEEEIEEQEQPQLQQQQQPQQQQLQQSYDDQSSNSISGGSNNQYLPPGQY